MLSVYRTAWKQLEDMSAEQAMQEYVSCVQVLDPDSSQKVTFKPGPLNKISVLKWLIFLNN